MQHFPDSVGEPGEHEEGEATQQFSGPQEGYYHPSQPMVHGQHA
jgi:hypothetical protein